MAFFLNIWKIPANISHVIFSSVLLLFLLCKHSRISFAFGHIFFVTFCFLSSLPVVVFILLFQPNTYNDSVNSNNAYISVMLLSTLLSVAFEISSILFVLLYSKLKSHFIKRRKKTVCLFTHTHFLVFSHLYKLGIYFKIISSLLVFHILKIV